MVKGDNKGHAYEKMIVEMLRKKKCIGEYDRGAGSGGGTDVTFVHRGKRFKLEIKNNIRDPDYGQKRLIPVREGGGWKWTWAAKESIVDYYTKQGVLEYLDSKEIVPRKYSKPDKEITVFDKKHDLAVFEDRSFKISSEAFSKFYEGKADYLQIGEGYGFYHLNEDVADLGTEKFEGSFILRFRVKSHHSFPIHNYSFFAVLKCVGIKKRSRYNIESFAGQEFPPIRP